MVTIKPMRCELGKEIGFSGLIGDQHAAAVAHGFRLHMLVGFRLLDDGRGMNAGLGGKGALADIGRLRIGARFSNSSKARDIVVRFCRALVIDADVEAVAVGFLQAKGRR